MVHVTSHKYCKLIIKVVIHCSRGLFFVWFGEVSAANLLLKPHSVVLSAKMFLLFLSLLRFPPQHRSFPLRMVHRGNNSQRIDFSVQPFTSRSRKASAVADAPVSDAVTHSGIVLAILLKLLTLKYSAVHCHWKSFWYFIPEVGHCHWWKAWC